MQLEQQESFEIKGPQLEVFGEAETRLPAAAKKRPAALAVLAVAIVASVLGIGGAQLKGQWRETSEIYTSQIDDYGNGIQQDFSNQADAAASLIRIASAVVGTDDADLQAAQTALDNWNEARPQRCQRAVHAEPAVVHRRRHPVHGRRRRGGQQGQRAVDRFV